MVIQPLSTRLIKLKFLSKSHSFPSFGIRTKRETFTAPSTTNRPLCEKVGKGYTGDGAYENYFLVVFRFDLIFFFSLILENAQQKVEVCAVCR